jgi:hypothetical protein
MGQGHVEQRWRGRPLRAWLVRAAVLTVPIVASVTVAAALTRLLSPAADLAGFAVRALAVLVPATVTLWLVDRVARRFLPLATLLRLSLVFPDKAPSRFAVARLVNSARELRQRVDAARRGVIPGEPGEAAKTILALVSAVSRHDRRTRGHSERVRIYTDMLAEEMGLAATDRDRLRWAALVHDTGKLVVPERILNKAGQPTDDEWEVLRRHPAEGARLCGPLLPWLGEAGRAILEHHERYDGGGYPAGLSGQEISLAGRMLAVTDAFEVMTAARPYKSAMSAAAAREELARHAGAQFDPRVVRAFLSLSLGRLRLAMGPLSWLAQWPFLAHLPRFGQNAGQAGAALGGAAALGAAGLLAPPASFTPPASRPAVSQEPAVVEVRPPAAPVARGAPPAPHDPGHVERGATRGGVTTPAAEPPREQREAPRAAPAPAPRPGPAAGAAPVMTPEPVAGPDPEATPTAGEEGEARDEDPATRLLTEELAGTVDDTVNAVEEAADDVIDALPDVLGDPVEDVEGVVEDTGVVEITEDLVEDTGSTLDGLLRRLGGSGLSG